MRISVLVKTRSRKTEVRQLGENRFVVRVTAPPVDGKANEKVIEALAAYFGRPKRCIRILTGETSRDKIVEIG